MKINKYSRVADKWGIFYRWPRPLWGALNRVTAPERRGLVRYITRAAEVWGQVIDGFINRGTPR